MKKKPVFIALIIVLIILILGITMYLIDMNRMKNNQAVVFSNWGYDYAPPEINPEDVNDFGVDSNIVIIKDGNINNEDLIENFINSANSKATEEISLIIREYSSNDEYIEKELKFIPGIASNETEEGETYSVNIGDFEKQQGHFVYIINNDESTSQTFNYKWWLKRNVEDRIVRLRFETSPYGFIDVAEFPVICSYSLESSNYTNKFELNYHQRKDKGLKTIIDHNMNKEYEYSVHTLGGDVDFTIDTDMVYTFDTALEQKVITIEDILEQAKMDAEYGICDEGAYSDGGSIEYLYEDYTILKFSNLNGLEDLVIGYKGAIIDEARRSIEQIEKLSSHNFTFRATIKEVIEYNGKIKLLVDGFDTNDINERGEFYCSIGENTKLIYKDNTLKPSDFKTDQNISIMYDGGVLETYPAQLSNVLQIELLDE